MNIPLGYPFANQTHPNQVTTTHAISEGSLLCGIEAPAGVKILHPNYASQRGLECPICFELIKDES